MRGEALPKLASTAIGNPAASDVGAEERVTKPRRPAPILYLIVPCYNEEAVLPLTIPVLIHLLEALISEQKASPVSRLLFVDDGSHDGTWTQLVQAHTECSYCLALRLSRNKGHQNALWAGLMTARQAADATVSLDCDLQDDPEAIRAMLDAYQDGADVVYGVRKDRRSDSFFKRGSAQFFYRLMRRLGADIVYNHADFRLLSRPALDALSEFSENTLFLRGLIPMLGFQTASVAYSRHPRPAGESKYPLKKMFAFAWDGITGLTAKPLHWITRLGAALSLLSLAMLVYILIRYFLGFTLPGWTSVALSVWFIGGLLLFSLGIIGEYIAKIFIEVKARPRYFIAEALLDPTENPQDSAENPEGSAARPAREARQTPENGPAPQEKAP